MSSSESEDGEEYQSQSTQKGILKIVVNYQETEFSLTWLGRRRQNIEDDLDEDVCSKIKKCSQNSFLIIELIIHLIDKKQSCRWCCQVYAFKRFSKITNKENWHSHQDSERL